MIPERLIFLDLETTGTRPQRDRITEVAMCVLDHGQPDWEWSTLIDPETPIPPYIEQLTGITSNMVAQAPTFAQVADEIRERLDGAVLVAHNARFDVGFLKASFRRLGVNFDCRTLCTVKLSRTLDSHCKGHSLDHLIQRHQLPMDKRHRALDDALAIRFYVQQMLKTRPAGDITAAIQKQWQQPSLPAHLDPALIKLLPTGPGVYLFYGEKGSLLYIGKSRQVRTRVLSHFSSDHRHDKEMRMSQQIRDIDAIPTAGELGALLLEARLIKERLPLHNRRLRRVRDLFSIHLEEPGAQARIISLSDISVINLGRCYGIFTSKRQADQTVRQWIKEHQLCAKLLGLEKGQGACFGYQIKQCHGACVGKEPHIKHHLRVIQAFQSQQLKGWPYSGPIGIEEHCPEQALTELHVFDRWCHLGSVHDKEGLADLFAGGNSLPFDRDSYRILQRYLKQHSNTVIHLQAYANP